jgi:hypothetical protein
MAEKRYRAESITGADLSVAGRLWLPEDEALSLRDTDLDIEDPEGRRIIGRIVGETPEEVVIETRGGEVLVKFVGRYVEAS